MSLLQTVQADAAIARLHTLCQRDIRRSVKGKLLLDETHWTNLMIDRAACYCRACSAADLPQSRCLTRCCARCASAFR